MAFLRARLDEDEQTARAATPGPWEWRQEHGEPWQPKPGGWLDYSGEYLETGGETPTLFGPGMTPHADAVHIARHNPARVLAEIDAKRRILNETWGGRDHQDLWVHHVRLLALPYAGHPEWREEWRP